MVYRNLISIKKSIAVYKFLFVKSWEINLKLMFCILVSFQKKISVLKYYNI